jgi:hypothetical protein
VPRAGIGCRHRAGTRRARAADVVAVAVVVVLVDVIILFTSMYSVHKR